MDSLNYSIHLTTIWFVYNQGDSLHDNCKIAIKLSMVMWFPWLPATIIYDWNFWSIVVRSWGLYDKPNKNRYLETVLSIILS